MKKQGPKIIELIHHFSECPAEFLLPPKIGKKGKVDTAAIVSDLFLIISNQPLQAKHRKFFNAQGKNMNAAHLKCVLVACWLFYFDWFHDKKELLNGIRSFLMNGLAPLAEVSSAADWIASSEKREEFVRFALFQLDLFPEGESEHIADDRLSAVSTIGRLDVIKQTRMAVERIKKLKQKMAEKKTREAATTYGRE